MSETSRSERSDVSGAPSQNGQRSLSLSTAAVRNLATTTKTVPQMQGITARWLLTLLPYSDTRTSSILLMRTGEELQGVVGLHQVGLPDEYQPGLSVRFMDSNEKAIMLYLVSAYYSAAVLVPGALGVLEHVEVGRYDD